MEFLIEDNIEQASNTYKKAKNLIECAPSTSAQLEQDTIDVSKLNLSDDESWLLECAHRSDNDVRKWLYDLPQSDLTSKNIDTRTFTRPKRRFTRPSIEKYNEELYGSENETLTNNETINGCIPEASSKPLHFDLNQASSSFYFEKILSNASMFDSFQNMSPPSLVNSMCSSTFTTLMENSFIKNDPVLREIRDTDFTASILQQETEPMFQSMTESFSSLNSDVPENFLRKVSFREGKKINEDKTPALNETFEVEKFAAVDNNCIENLEGSRVSNEYLNSTFSKKATAPINFNNTYQRHKSNNLTPELATLNSKVTIESNQLRDEKTMENIKRLLNRRPSPSLDLNRLSYIVETNDRLNNTFSGVDVKRNSFGSTDSGDNLEYMSLSSGSSKSSTKVLSVDSINAIVELQEQSLRRIMSTPRARTLSKNLWSSSDLSPISAHNSDPELSSSENSQHRTFSAMKPIKKQKSIGNIVPRMPPKIMNPVRNLEKITGLRMQKPSNLNSMGHTLKGSYTSLKPTNSNLPVAPPLLDTTVTIAKNSAKVPLVKEVGFVKPQPPRASGLPRPVSGLPRPVSRIPGPRNIRAVSKSAGQQGRC